MSINHNSIHKSYLDYHRSMKPKLNLNPKIKSTLKYKLNDIIKQEKYEKYDLYEPDQAQIDLYNTMKQEYEFITKTNMKNILSTVFNINYNNVNPYYECDENFIATLFFNEQIQDQKYYGGDKYYYTCGAIFNPKMKELPQKIKLQFAIIKAKGKISYEYNIEKCNDKKECDENDIFIDTNILFENETHLRETFEQTGDFQIVKFILLFKLRKVYNNFNNNDEIKKLEKRINNYNDLHSDTKFSESGKKYINDDYKNTVAECENRKAEIINDYDNYIKSLYKTYMRIRFNTLPDCKDNKRLLIYINNRYDTNILFTVGESYGDCVINALTIIKNAFKPEKKVYKKMFVEQNKITINDILDFKYDVIDLISICNIKYNLCGESLKTKNFIHEKKFNDKLYYCRFTIKNNIGHGFIGINTNKNKFTLFEQLFIINNDNKNLRTKGKDNIIVFFDPNILDYLNIQNVDPSSEKELNENNIKHYNIHRFNKNYKEYCELIPGEVLYRNIYKLTPDKSKNKSKQYGSDINIHNLNIMKYIFIAIIIIIIIIIINIIHNKIQNNSNNHKYKYK